MYSQEEIDDMVKRGILKIVPNPVHVLEKKLLERIAELEKRIVELENAPKNHYYYPAPALPPPEPLEPMFPHPNQPSPFWKPTPSPGWPVGPTFTCSTGRKH